MVRTIFADEPSDNVIKVQFVQVVKRCEAYCRDYEDCHKLIEGAGVIENAKRIPVNGVNY